VIDTHAHLDALEEPDAALARAREAGVARVLTIGTGSDSCRRALALARAHDGVHAALGIDPHQAGTREAERLDELRALLGEPGVVAVGECGLDYHYGAEREAEQRALFEAQLALARERELPVVVHTRAANADTEALLRAHDGTVVMHCFSEPGLLDAALDRGWYVSFAGNVTYPKADDLRAAAARIPAERLLAETDSPYLAPQPVRGRRNEPAFVRHTVAALAAARGEDAGELGARIDANASAAFRLPA
jgi:TatD DNase family protein